jgi:hypothetical protein
MYPVSPGWPQVNQDEIELEIDDQADHKQRSADQESLAVMTVSSRSAMGTSPLL